jgi:hypothetical protein
MKRLNAFWLGLQEFRRSVTTHFAADLIEDYDRGRELAHMLTLRRYE